MFYGLRFIEGVCEKKSTKFNTLGMVPVLGNVNREEIVKDGNLMGCYYVVWCIFGAQGHSWLDNSVVVLIQLGG